jgi:hypothetical protein
VNKNIDRIPFQPGHHFVFLVQWKNFSCEKCKMKAWMMCGKPDKLGSQLSAATGNRYPKNGGVPHVIDK